jgi:hypothetical protein
MDWSQIVQQHGPLVWTTVYRLLRHDADAADCFQRTFLSALVLSRTQTVRNWPGLLQRLGTARALELLRQRLRQAQRLRPLLADVAVADGTPEPDQAAAVRELSEKDSQGQQDRGGRGEGLVTITEQEEERVGALWIDNKSDRPLYLQEGERLIGGKQDRTIISSLVIPPKSGKTSVPTFCVERSRWVEGNKGRQFGFSVNPALAPKGVRGAAKVEGSQTHVWGCVAAQKVSANKTLQCPNTNSSVKEMLDAPQVQTLSEEYAVALGRALDRAENGDAVGMAIVFNGQIEEVNLYPNRALFRKLFPRLVRAYAVQAALLKDQAKGGQPMTAEAVAQFLQARDAKAQKKNSLDEHNDVQVNELGDSRFQCTTRYNGRSIHWQLMAKNREGGTAGAEVLGSDW